MKEPIQDKVVGLYREGSPTSQKEGQYYLWKEYFERCFFKLGSIVFKKMGVKGDEDLLKDALVEAFEVVDQKLKNGEADVRFEGLILTIAERKLEDAVKRTRFLTYAQETPNEVFGVLSDEQKVINEEDAIVKKQMLDKVLDAIGESCKKILLLRLVQGYSVKDLVKMGLYKDENVVSATFSRCLKKAKEIQGGIKMQGK